MLQNTILYKTISILWSDNYRDNVKDLQQLLSQRLNLDRRRLEEGFLQYACLEAIHKHNLYQNPPVLPTDRNELVEQVTKRFNKAFLDKWRGKTK